MKFGNDIFTSISKIVRHDRKNVFYLVYYSAITAILVLSIPLASSYVINSVLAHASISVFVLGFIVITAFILITVLRVIQEYIVEKFQQEIFVKTAIEISDMASDLKNKAFNTKFVSNTDKYMNYFFEITSIQKLFPIILLDGVGLVIKFFVSLLLLLIFDPLLFFAALGLFLIYITLLFAFGNNGIKYAINRSDTKHKSIFFLQSIPNTQQPRKELLKTCDDHLNDYVEARQKSFSVIIKQLALTFFMEGFILSGFLILGGSLVISGDLPVGEFVAAEIVIMSIVYSLKIFVKQIDYIYEMIEGFNKLNKLTVSLGGDENE